MPTTARFSKYKRNNYLIWILFCIICALWFGYDGYYNEKFINENLTEEGSPNSKLAFNRKTPPVFAAAAVLLVIRLLTIRKAGVTADEKGLIINNRLRIPYDSIEKINKTYFDSKGFFTVTYKDESGNENERKISDRVYDDLEPVLEETISRIS